MFNRDLFEKKLGTRWLGREFLYAEELDSTNSYMKQLPAAQISHGQVCLADHQRRGRGQYERSWQAAPGQNLTFTVAFRPAEADRFHLLTLACAKAIVGQLESEGELDAGIKWPNDIYAEGKKLGGLLTEATFSGNTLDRLLVGIGLNINQASFSGELRGKAASLKTLTGRTYEREPFLAQLLSRMEYEYGRWHKRDIGQLRKINRQIIGYGQRVRLNINGTVSDEKVKFLGVNEKGQLVTVNAEGTLKTYSYEQIRLVSS